MALCIVDRNGKYGNAQVFGNCGPDEIDESALAEEISKRIPAPLVWLPESGEIGIEANNLRAARETFAGIGLDWDEIISSSWSAYCART